MINLIKIKHMTNKSAFENLVNDSKLRINECSMEYINDMTKNNTFDGILIDIRELSEHEDGCVSNSIHISRDILEAKIETLVPNKERTKNIFILWWRLSFSIECR